MAAERKELLNARLEIYCPLCGKVIDYALTDIEAVQKKRLHAKNTDNAHPTYLMNIREEVRPTKLI